MKIWLPRALFLAAFVLLLSYFIYREASQPWVFNGFTTSGPADTEEEEGIADQARSEDRARAQPQAGGQGRDGSRSVEGRAQGTANFRLSEQPPTGTAAASELEKRLFEAQATLARSMEQRLANQVEAARGQFDRRGAKMQQIRHTIGRITEQVAQENAGSAEALASSIAEIENDLTQLGAVSLDLSTARDAWRQTYSELTEVGEISGDVLDERNYDFEEYAVGSNQTLSQIARSLQRRHQVTRANLETLIPMFNDIETRTRPAVGRRGAVQVVANQTLRIPLPKNAGNMLNDSGVSESLRTQREAMESASERYDTLESSLEQRIVDMRLIVERIRGLEALTADLEESLSALEPEQLEFLDASASPEQREAWQAFNEASEAYAQIDSPELQRAAARHLEEATQRLVEAYRPASAIELEEGATASEDDLEWFLQFVEPYDPTGN